MGKLSVRAVCLAPVGVQREDRLDLCGHQPVHGVAAVGSVGEASGPAAVGPAPRPALVEREHPAGALMDPALSARVVDQLEQRQLFLRADAGGYRA